MIRRDGIIPGFPTTDAAVEHPRLPTIPIILKDGASASPFGFVRADFEPRGRVSSDFGAEDVFGAEAPKRRKARVGFVRASSGVASWEGSPGFRGRVESWVARSRNAPGWIMAPDGVEANRSGRMRVG